MKKSESPRITAAIRIDKKVWDEANELLTSSGLSRSKWIEINLRSLVRMKYVNLKEVMQEFEEGLPLIIKKEDKKKLKKKT